MQDIIWTSVVDYIIIHTLIDHFGLALICNVGEYSLTAVLGASVFIDVSYKDHEFKRIIGPRNPESTGLISTPIYKNPVTGEIFRAKYNITEYFLVSDNIINLDFEDITTSILVLQVAGGLCNRSLGISRVSLKRQMCSLSFKRTLEIEADRKNAEKKFKLPAYQFELEFDKIVGLTSYSENMIGFFERTEQFIQRVDLGNETLAHRSFIYHPKPNLLVRIAPSIDVKDCTGAVVLQRDKDAKVTVVLSESFELGESVEDCPQVEGEIIVYSDLSSTAKTVDDCTQGCKLTTEQQINNATGTSKVVRSFATHPFLVGDPTVTAPFTRDLLVDVNVFGYTSPTTSEVQFHMNDY